MEFVIYAHRWSELSRKLELWVEIHELNEQGEYVPVELSPKPEVLTGGVFQLRQVECKKHCYYIYLVFVIFYFFSFSTFTDCF